MEQLYFETADEWREWLQNNQDRSIGVWLELFRPNLVRPPFLRTEAAIEEALCFGWVNSISGDHNTWTSRSVDSEKYAIPFTPIKDDSQWSTENRELAEKLIKEKRMTKFGVAKIETANRLGTWRNSGLHIGSLAWLVLVSLYILGGLVSFGATSCMLEPVESISVGQIFVMFIIGLILAIPVTLNIGIPLLLAGIEPPGSLAELAKITLGLATISFMILVLGFRQSPYFSIGAIIVGAGGLYLLLIVASVVESRLWRVQSPLSRIEMWNYATLVLAILMMMVSIGMGYFRMTIDNFPWSC